MEQTLQYQGHKIEIIQDEFPYNPREEHDNLGTIFYTSTNYLLGDECVDRDRITEIIEDEEYIFLEVYAYIHSGVTIWTSLSDRKPCIPGSHRGWDSGMCGIIAVNKAKVRKEFGWSHITAKRKGDILRYLSGEVELFNDYLTGNVYGYQVTDNEGFEDSCWGFYGDSEYCLEAAKDIVNWHVKSKLEKHIQKRKSQIRYRVPFQYRKPFTI